MKALELLQEMAPHINDQKGRPFDFIKSVNTVLHAINKELIDRKSNLACGDLSIDFTADTASAAVPEDFEGLHGKPWISGSKITIDPICGNDCRADYDGKTGQRPKAYSVESDSIVLFPTPNVDLTLKGRYYRDITDITGMDDELPLPQFIDTLRVGINLLNENGHLFCVTTQFRSMIEEDVVRRLRRRDDHPRRSTAYWF